jgi:nitrogen fixation protein FixH
MTLGARFWAFLPVGLLAAMVTGLGWLASIAIDDPGFALEPDYYNKAVHYDLELEQARKNQRLGWQARVSLAPARDARAPTAVAVTLTDASGAALRSGRVELAAFYNARASNRHQLLLSDEGTGVYRGSLPSPHPGLWEFRVVADVDGTRFTSTSRLQVGP